MSKTLDVKRIREDFPILKRKIGGKPLVYLDNAATSQKPISVIKAISDYYEGYNANVHRGIHTLANETTQAYENAREAVRRRPKPDRPVFVHPALRLAKAG